MGWVHGVGPIHQDILRVRISSFLDGVDLLRHLLRHPSAAFSNLAPISLPPTLTSTDFGLS